MAGFWTALKNIFTGGGGAASSSAPAPSGKPERFCLTCHKMTAGTLNPKEAGGKKAMDFVCDDCSSSTQVLA